MAEVILSATMDEFRILHLQIPEGIRVGDLEVVVRERPTVGNGMAIWREAREELEAMRNED